MVTELLSDKLHEGILLCFVIGIVGTLYEHLLLKVRCVLIDVVNYFFLFNSFVLKEMNHSNPSRQKVSLSHIHSARIAASTSSSRKERYCTAVETEAWRGLYEQDRA